MSTTSGEAHPPATANAPQKTDTAMLPRPTAPSSLTSLQVDRAPDRAARAWRAVTRWQLEILDVVEQLRALRAARKR